MTTLIVKPIDFSEPGSFRAQQRLMRLARDLKSAQDQQDPFAVAEMMENIESLIIPRLRTDDGTSVDAVLDEISAEDFYALMSGIMGSVEPVPTANGAHSSVPLKAAAKPRTGP